jgi:hypothetical protein
VDYFQLDAVADFGGKDIKHFASMEDGKYLDCLSNYQLLLKNFASWSY